VDTNILGEHATSVATVNPEDGGSLFLQNVGIHLQDYTVCQPRRPQSAIMKFSALRNVCYYSYEKAVFAKAVKVNIVVLLICLCQ
jgi:hypothetical protein